ncbi:hypothetical protein EON65_29455 [archaeon]|nr:MAG: hypothetical protein EON65_29455 [archaeon]
MFFAVCICLWSGYGTFAAEIKDPADTKVVKPIVAVEAPKTTNQQANPTQVPKPAAPKPAPSPSTAPKPAPAPTPAATVPTPVAAPVTKPAPASTPAQKSPQPTSMPSMMFQAPSLDTVAIATHKPTHTSQTHKDLPTVSPIFAKHTPTQKPVFADEKNAAEFKNEIEEEDEEAASATHYIFIFVFLLAIGSVTFYMCKR